MMFIDTIGSQAARDPYRTAVCLPTLDVTYRDFDRAINQVANRLKTTLPDRSRVCIVIDNIYLHWLAILALARLGHVSASLSPATEEMMLGVIKPAAVITDRPVSAASYAWRTIEVSTEWLKDVLANEPAMLDAPAPPMSAPARIVASSGTTGTPKKTLFTHQGLRERMLTASELHAPGSFQRPACLLGIDTISGYIAATRAWWFGGAACFLGPRPALFASKRVTGLIASPALLRHFIGRMPADMGPMPGLSIMLAGARPPRDLAFMARLRLSPDIMVSYGSTEAGGIAGATIQSLDRNPELTGYVLSGCEVEVVDDEGRPLPPGEIGELRTRAATMVSSYLEDEAATARHFRDGWFHPGDLGSLSAAGELKVLGRVNDVINAGGVKIAPDALEEAILGAPGIADAGVFSTESDNGGVHFWAAIVKVGPVDTAALHAAVKQRMASGNAPIRFVAIDEIPRNAMGKIQRAELRRQVMDRANTPLPAL